MLCTFAASVASRIATWYHKQHVCKQQSDLGKPRIDDLLLVEAFFNLLCEEGHLVDGSTSLSESGGFWGQQWVDDWVDPADSTLSNTLKL